MADSKLSELTEASSLGQSDFLYVTQGGVSKKVAVSKLGQAIKLTNLIIPGFGFKYDANQSVDIYIYDSESNMDPLVRISSDLGLLIRGESSGSSTLYYQVSWDALASIGTFLSYDKDNTSIDTGDSFIEVTDKTSTPNKTGRLASDRIEFTWGQGSDYVQITREDFQKLVAMIPTMSGKITSDNGYYVNPASKKPEAVVVDLYALDPETAEVTDTLVQGAKYKSDGIEYHNGSGTLGQVSSADILALSGLANSTSDLATLLSSLDSRITALENA